MAALQGYPTYDELQKEREAKTPTPAGPVVTTQAQPTAVGTTDASGLPPEWLRSRATALVGGLAQTGADIASNMGFTPRPLPQDVQAAMQANPRLAWTGQTLGGIAATAPLMVLAGPTLAGLNPWIGGAIAGAGQNLLVGPPSQPWWERGGLGAATGGVLGGVGNRIAQWFGQGAQLASQDVQNAAQLVAQPRYGITLQRPNLPMAGGPAGEMGAQASVPQAAQINRAVGNVLGENINSFDGTTLNNLANKIGGEISAAANKGTVNLVPGGPLETALQGINQDAIALARTDPLGARNIQAEVNKVLGAFTAPKAPGVMPGTTFDSLVGHGSKLQSLIRKGNDDVSGLAQRIDAALRTGFQDSSPAGVYNDWVDARTRYKLLNAIEDSVQTAAGGANNINPGGLYNTLIQQRYFPDIPRLTEATGGRVGQMGDLAQALRTLFGGGAAPPPAAPSFWRQALPYFGVGTGLEAAGHVLTNPGAIGAASDWLANTPGALMAGGMGLGALGLRSLGQGYQRSQPYINQLIQGATSAPNRLAPWIGAWGTQANPLVPQR